MLKGTHLESVDAVKKKTADMFGQLSEIDLLHAFYQWKSKLQRYISGRGQTLILK